jgi:hypothetical protein
VLLQTAEVILADRAFSLKGVQRQLLAILHKPSRVELLNRLRVCSRVHGTAGLLLPVMHGAQASKAAR